MTGWAAAVLCAGLAVWLPAAHRSLPERARRLFGGGPPERASWHRRPAAAGVWLRRRREWACLGAGLLVGVAGRSPLPVCAGALAVPLARRWLRTREAERERAARVTRVIALCAAAAAELRSGSHPGQALTAAFRSCAAGVGPDRRRDPGPPDGQGLGPGTGAGGGAGPRGAGRTGSVGEPVRWAGGFGRTAGAGGGSGGGGAGGVPGRSEEVSAVVRGPGPGSGGVGGPAGGVGRGSGDRFRPYSGRWAVARWGRGVLPGAGRSVAAGRSGPTGSAGGSAVANLAGRHPGAPAAFRHRSGVDADDGAESGVLAAAAFGGDVPGALRAAARAPGAEGLAGMAACWRVSVDGGAGLAAGLDRLERALRAERDQRASLHAQLAGARSTAVVLAVLPVAGVLMGSALGADPLRVLLHSPAGLGCLLTGLLLEGLGLCWVRRIVRTGERS